MGMKVLGSPWFYVAVSLALMVGSIVFANVHARQERVAAERHRANVEPEPAAKVRADRRAKWARRAFFVYMIGTFSWRVRTTSQLGNAPVDAAASVRLAADFLAFVIAAAVWLGQGLESSDRRFLPKHLGGLAVRRWYGLYILVAVIGTAEAVKPTLVIFRVVELTIVLFVASILIMTNDFTRVMATVRRFLFLMAALVGLSVAIAPHSALQPQPGSVVPFELNGVYPQMSANTVGFIGVCLFAFGITATKRWPGFFTSGLGLALVILAQYRTGYIAVAVVLAVRLVGSRNINAKLLVALFIPLVIFASQSQTFKTAWIRGEQASNSAQNLSGRTDFWAMGIKVTERSPWIGTGLSSGSRFEVLPLFNDPTVSTIHGTWVEAYVGTGRLGVFGLGMFFLVTLIGALRARRTISYVPLVVLAAFCVRSLTGSTIELADWTLMIVLVVSLRTWRTLRLAAVKPDDAPNAVAPSQPALVAA